MTEREAQFIFCPECGHEIRVLKEIRRVNPRGSGAHYAQEKIKKLNVDHQIALRTLFNLGATEPEHRKTMDELISKANEYKKQSAGKGLHRESLSRALSELQGLARPLARSYDNKTDHDKENYTFTYPKGWQGWYLTVDGLNWCFGKVDFLDGELIPQEMAAALEDMLPRRIEKIAIENGVALKNPKPQLVIGEN